MSVENEDQNVPEENVHSEAETTEPVLNRAQRRAMAKGKGAAPAPRQSFGNNAQGPGGRGNFVPTSSKIPRTGHK